MSGTRRVTCLSEPNTNRSNTAGNTMTLQKHIRYLAELVEHEGMSEFEVRAELRREYPEMPESQIVELQETVTKQHTVIFGCAA